MQIISGIIRIAFPWKICFYSSQFNELIQLANDKKQMLTIYQNRRWDGYFRVCSTKCVRWVIIEYSFCLQKIR
ncbi:MAG: hypothetical protein A2W90_16190 [Bacteroidetes bacterium GWF2_42_66]|nr:MAG: hypothetical protein A2W89_05120 [Bacteroidetes bacterium GWE2_42_39]OFY46278.1 MAG: hypothetical protein A2W90_16190 [Bacteroidetes bacterium GWF2_42_66]HCU60050.1 hypothetical protein [Prolixibacteraceae bacterium]